MKIDYWSEWVNSFKKFYDYIYYFTNVTIDVSSVVWITYLFEDRWSLSLLLNYYTVDLYHLYSYGGHFSNNFVKIYSGIIKRAVNLI